jgi:hypothetical protein
MRYALLIYSDPAIDAQRSPAESQAIWAQYGVYTADVDQRGISRGGEALQDASKARTVRVRDGQVLSTDGPFAETKEQLGGFYLLECASMEEAVELASRIPTATYGSIEVRPVIDFA